MTAKSTAVLHDGDETAVRSPFPNGRSTPRHRGEGMSPRQQDLLGPLGARHDHHAARLTFMPASIACHTRPWQRPVDVAREQLSPRAVTKLPTRPAVGKRPTIPGRPDRPVWVFRFVDAVVMPTAEPLLGRGQV